MDEVKNYGYSKILRGMSIDDDQSKNNPVLQEVVKQKEIENKLNEGQKFIKDKKSDSSRSIGSKLSSSGKQNNLIEIKSELN